MTNISVERATYLFQLDDILDMLLNMRCNRQTSPGRSRPKNMSTIAKAT